MPTKTAIVTGASAGIGKDIALTMLDQGYKVIALNRRAPDYTHANLVAYDVDLIDAKATAEVAKDIAAHHQVTNIVHNAGMIRPALIEDVKLEDLHALVDLHMGAAITLTQAALPAMKTAGFGRIVLMSTRAIVGLPSRTVYAGTKSAMIAMTRTWAMELGAHGITVNAIAPGPVVTDMFTHVVPAESEKAKALAASLPRRRLGRPDDVTRATMFFLDEQNDWITGQTLFVCGGSSLGGLAL
ncbi:SDR family oxidoreductase [Govanella unica]|uniref:SDR family oxidoreductase n=1 Tax=Govanella unica TaxID=2975056 RepID=A0A9X3Z6V0_9PROT|nr:SDR family oxidoreductase [Govania unica]MDA5193501.1 SDR family oxidoreductase [Govania unica]